VEREKEELQELYARESRLRRKLHNQLMELQVCA
jgi:hypothetical protein